MIRQHSSPASRALVSGLDVMTAALIVIAVAQAPAGGRWLAVAAAVVLAVVYIGGRATIRVHERPIDSLRGRWWPDAAYIAAMVLAWIVLLWFSPAGLWLAFPLMLLQMHVMGPHRGVVAVAVTTTIAIANGLLVQVGPEDAATAFVIGPLLGGVVAAGVVLGIEAFVRESHERQRTLEELTQAREHLALTERERAVTAERTRLAREIHDTIAQSLSAIDLLLRAASDSVGSDDTKARDLVERARLAARDSLDEARRVVQDLTPAELGSSTLVGALRDFADRTARLHNDSVAGRQRPLDISVEVSGEARRLPVTLETALLRIAQSALTNVSEHAAATRVRVTVTYDDDIVTLDVVDDGKGFDASQLDRRSEPRGFGLPAIRTRSQELGGTFALESNPGEGTAIAVALPTRPPENSV